MSSHEVWCFSALVAASFFSWTMLSAKLALQPFFRPLYIFWGPLLQGTQAARKLEQSPFAGPILCGSSFAEPMLRGKPFGRTFFFPADVSGFALSLPPLLDVPTLIIVGLGLGFGPQPLTALPLLVAFAGPGSWMDWPRQW